MPVIDVAPVELAALFAATAPIAGGAPVARAALPAMSPASGPARSGTPDWLNEPLLTARPARPVLATMLTVVLAPVGAAAVFRTCALLQLLVPWQPLQSWPTW